MKPSFKENCIRHLPKLALLFIVSQPVLDVLTYWQTELALPSYGVGALRWLLLACVFAAGVLLTARRRVYYIAAGVMGLYVLLHILACSIVGYRDPLADLTDQARVLLIPVLTLCFITLLRRNDATLAAIKRGLVLALAVILLVELLATLTGSDPHTYYEKKIGVLGWFQYGNTQSVILSLITPIAIAWAVQRFSGKLLPLAAVSLCCFAMLYLCGTRLSYFALAAIGLGMGVCILLADRKHLRQALCVVLLAALFVGLYPFSPMRRNQIEQQYTADVKQQRLSAAAAEYGVDTSARSTDNMDALAAAYRYSLQGMIDRFGLETVAKEYGNTLEQSQVFERRKKLIIYCELVMQDAPVTSKLFGLELAELRQKTMLYSFYRDSFTEGVEIFEPENDFHAVYYESGLVGLALLLAFLLYFGLRSLIALLRHFRQVYSLDLAAFCGAYVMILLAAYATASILRRINASVYLAIVLAGLWYLSQTPKEKHHADQCHHTGL